MKLEEVKQFLDYVKRKGIVAENSVSSWSAAISSVTSVLEDSEKTIEYVLENPEIIKNRLQHQSKDASGSTIAKYISRTTLALKHFLEWHKDRGEWEKKQASKAKTEAKPKVKAKKVEEEKESIQQVKRVNLDSTFQQIPVPCSSGGVFNVSIPESYTMNDLVRVVWALAVHAQDFDPAAVLDRYGKPSVQGLPSMSKTEVISQ